MLKSPTLLQKFLSFLVGLHIVPRYLCAISGHRRYSEDTETTSQLCVLTRLRQKVAFYAAVV